MTKAQINPARRVELILQQLDALPTLSTVAVRLLDLTTADDSKTKDVIRLVSSDPALCGKVLKLCRCMAGGRARHVKTIDTAVKMVGFEALRTAVLSVQVYEILDGIDSPGGEKRSERAVFDREMAWQHCVAVAVAGDWLAERSRDSDGIHRGEAFICGLLHDLGLLALHVVLPRSFDRVCELAESHGRSLDDACRRIIGLDGRIAGKRLAENWQLPQRIIDVIWLHGQPCDALPKGPQGHMVRLISLADAIARRQHIAPIGHGPDGENLQVMGEAVGLGLGALDEIVPRLHEEVAQHAAAIGLGEQPQSTLLLRSISRANEALGRANTALMNQVASAQRQSAVLEAIARFHDPAGAGPVEKVLSRVVQSARSVFGDAGFSVLYQRSCEEPCEWFGFSDDGRMVQSRTVAAPAGSEPLADLVGAGRSVRHSLDRLPWMGQCLGEAVDPRTAWVLPLPCGSRVAAAVLHDGCHETCRDLRPYEALIRTWGAAVGAAAEHDSAQRFAEQLAHANRTLAETRDSLAQAQALAALGEFAAGAAHEMNTPLAIICGRSQLLAGRLEDAEHRTMAEQIVEQSHLLSDMITALRTVAEPAVVHARPVDLEQLLHRIVQEVGPKRNGAARISLVVQKNLPPVHIDPDQFAKAVHELLRNALDVEPAGHIELRVQTDPLDDRLKVQVTDEGIGLSDNALAHAFDPFFSDKPAGRQPGLGLARARRLVEAHHGRLTLENDPAGGAVATIWLDAWRGRGAA